MAYISNYKKNNEENKAVSYEVEYNTLRAEILQNHKNCLQILGFAITATTAILIYAIKISGSRNPDTTEWLFLLPHAVILPSYLLYLSQVAATFRMGSYIKVVLESKPECKRLNFETYWSYYYRKDQNSNKWSKLLGIINDYPAHSLFFLMSFFSNLLFHNSYNGFQFCLILLLILYGVPIVIFFLATYIFDPASENKIIYYDKKWKAAVKNFE